MRNYVLLFGASLALAGCNLSVEGVTCSTDSDCDNGRCDRGVCVETGAADGSIPDASRPDASRPDASTPDAGPECLTEANCPKCEKCSDGKCVFQDETEDLKDECEALGCTTGTCDGNGGCGLKPLDTPCRASAGDCDVAEVCNGTDPDCPADGFALQTKECRKSNGDCDDAEYCTGTSAACPTDAFKASNIECRKAANACDLAENCTGTAAACPSDEKQPSGHVCVQESCTVSTHHFEQTCDGNGKCSDPASEECGPYVCGGSKCKGSCEADSDCVTSSLCDFRSGICASSVVPVDCAASASKLQSEIDKCSAGAKCYLRVSGTCSNIKVQNKDVFISGGTINPSTTAGAAGAAVYAVEAAGETTSLVLYGLTIQGAYGTGGHGVLAEGTGGTTGQPELVAAKCEIGGPGVNNTGAGISATNATVTVKSTKIHNNTGGPGVALNESGFTIENTIIARNAASTGPAGITVFANSAVSPKVFRANTVAMNTGGGIRCEGAKGDTAVLSSLFWNTDGAEVTGACSPDASSDVRDGQDACSDGKATEPTFVKIGQPNADYHLQSGSPCLNKVACIPDLKTDVDGEPRKNGDLCDIGADEVWP